MAGKVRKAGSAVWRGVKATGRGIKRGATFFTLGSRANRASRNADKEMITARGYHVESERIKRRVEDLQRLLGELGPVGASKNHGERLRVLKELYSIERGYSSPAEYDFLARAAESRSRDYDARAETLRLRREYKIGQNRIKKAVHK